MRTVTLYDEEITRSLDLTEIIDHIRENHSQSVMRRRSEPHPVFIACIVLGALMLGVAWSGLVGVFLIMLVL